jgi:hypothetical protein
LQGTSLDKYAQFLNEPAMSESKFNAPIQPPKRVLKPFAALTAQEKAAIEHSKSNSTSTMYISSTIAVPDVDRILLSVGLLLEQMLKPPSGGTLVIHFAGRLFSSPDFFLIHS